MTRIELASRLAGAVWGHLVGDAVGVPYEFGAAVPAGEVVFGARGTWTQPAGTWSDDGALMLALLDSLLTAGFDPEDQGRRALAWYQGTAYTPDGDGRFDVGIATRAAMEALGQGVPAVDAGAPSPQHGNGSLMRILPVGLVDRDADAMVVIDHAHLASRVTHRATPCQVACALYALTVTRLLRGEAPARALAWALATARRAYRHGPSERLAALDELEAWTGRSGRGFVLDSFWSAWDAFEGAADYADAIRRAVAYGNDTDTTAAIAGGLAGARWGWASIPPEWRDGMRGAEVASPLVDGLVGPLGVRTSTGSPLRVDGIPLDGTRLAGSGGRLGITFLPGKKKHGWSGDHWRDLRLDLARLRSAGVDLLVLHCEDAELEDCLVPELPAVMAADGPPLLRHPIRDPRPPSDLLAYEALVRQIVGRLERGEHVAIACRGGMDRSGMTAACVLRELGLGSHAAIGRVQASRRDSISLRDQQAVVHGWRVASPAARAASSPPSPAE